MAQDMTCNSSFLIVTGTMWLNTGFPERRQGHGDVKWMTSAKREGGRGKLSLSSARLPQVRGGRHQESQGFRRQEIKHEMKTRLSLNVFPSHFPIFQIPYLRFIESRMSVSQEIQKFTNEEREITSAAGRTGKRLATRGDTAIQ